MTRQLVLYFNTTVDDLSDDTERSPKNVGYSLFDQGNVIEHDSVDIARLKELLATKENENCEVTLVIPGEHVTSLTVKPPKGSRRHITQAIPYLLEEELAAPVELLHIAYSDDIFSRTAADEDALCAVIEKQLLNNCLHLLSENGVILDQVIPDYWTLPVSGEPQCARKDHRILIRLNSAEGIVIPANAEQILPNELLPDLPDLTVEHIAEWQLANVPSPPFNLLQGEFKPVSKVADLGWLRPSAIVAGICLAVFISYFLITGWYFDSKATELANQGEQRYRELFPNDRKIIDIRRQMQAHINAGSDANGNSVFFDLLGAYARAAAEQGDSANIRNIRFDQSDGSLQLELQVNAINNANTLSAAIKKQRVNAEVLSANSNAEGVIARLKLNAEVAP